jgi:phenylpyruvate tautomerase PptA (4-oxalocrotonate tautomerase family)
MAQVRIEVDAGITVEVVEGGNSTAEIAALQAQVTALQAKIAAAKEQLASVAVADATEDAARAAAIAALE